MRRHDAMTMTPPPLGDDDMSTEGTPDDADNPMLGGDADSTDADSTDADATDGDSTDSTDGDSTDADGTDGTAL
jgi:hypothetical protein